MAAVVSDSEAEPSQLGLRIKKTVTLRGEDADA